MVLLVSRALSAYTLLLLLLVLLYPAALLVNALAIAPSGSHAGKIPESNKLGVVGRRDVLRQAAPATAAATAMALTITRTHPAYADDASPMATINDLLSRLKGVPTFCIVSPDGAAYMLFNKDQAMAIGYAFTTFPGALSVLGDAQRNAQEKGYFDTWKDATITTIPLDIAVRLALKKKTRVSPKEQSLDTLLMVIPGAVRIFCAIESLVYWWAQ